MGLLCCCKKKNRSIRLTQHKCFGFLYLTVFMCFPAVTSGAFCCDVVLDPQLDSWTPSEVCRSVCVCDASVLVTYMLASFFFKQKKCLITILSIRGQQNLKIFS